MKAIGLNRAECLQRQGKYPPKKKEEKFLGLEASGEIYDSQGSMHHYSVISCLMELPYSLADLMQNGPL